MTARLLELELDSQLSEVTRARRWAAEVLADLPFAEDAQLVLTELVTNAVLHGEPPVVARLVPGATSVQVEVADGGRRLPVRVSAGDSAMTGRGLEMVARLSSQWGVEPDTSAAGKVVFAVIDGHPHEAGTDDGDIDVDALLAGWADDDLDEPLFTVELGDVPTALLVEAKAHVDNAVRELTLAAAAATAAGRELAPPLLRLVEVVTGTFADARAQLKQQAAAAAARGDALTHLALRLPAAAVEAGEQYLAALDELDDYARAAQLLSIETPAVHAVFRRWYLTGLVEQLRAKTQGAPPPPVPTLTDRLAAEVTALAPLREVARRLALLQHVTTTLAGARDTGEITRIVVDAAISRLGAHGARIYLLDDELLRLSSAAGGGDAELADPYETLPVSSDLPGGVAVRTGKPVVARSLSDLARQFPALAGIYPQERSLLVAPLMSDGQARGVLALTFLGESRIDEDTQRAFVTTLADVTTQALERAEATAAATAAQQRLTLLAQASAVLAAESDVHAVLRTLGDLTVPLLADWVVIELLDGEQLRAVTTAHTDPERKRWAQQMADRWPVDMTAPAGSPSVLRSGRSERFDAVSDDVLQAVAVDDEHLRTLRSLGMHSALIVPLTGRGGTVGAITMIFAESARRYDDQIQQLAEDLARRAALAVELAARPHQDGGAGGAGAPPRP